MKNNKLLTFICLVNCLIVFIFFSHTLGYSWKTFDESIIFEESIYPIPATFSEIFEIITSFGLTHHFESSNPFYSNISHLRSNPINVVISLFVFWLFQKNAIYYHVLSLTLHILNTGLLFLLLNKIRMQYAPQPRENNSLIVCSLLTLFWALHPVNVETVVFACNWPALISYFLCLIIIFYFITLDAKNSKLCFFFLFILYLVTLFNTEYSIVLPFILFLYSLATKRSFQASFNKTLPLFLALMVFIIFSIFSLGKENLYLTKATDLTVTLERVFWLAPQILFHFLKLILFPAHLSIDQTSFVKLSKTLFEVYSIFCFLIMCSIFFTLFFSLIYIKQRFFFYFFISLCPFLVALLPYLHIISPIYNLSSERYLYFPLLMLVLGSSHIVFSVIGRDNARKVSTVILCIILCIFGTRTLIRTLDWKDSVTLLKSAVNIAPNELYKALRTLAIGTSLRKSNETVSNNEIESYTKKAIDLLVGALSTYENEEEIYQNKTPQVLKFYGLDPKALKAKSAFLLAYAQMDLSRDPVKAFQIFSPYVKDLNVLDTEILKFYYRLSFETKRYDEAENILLKVLDQKRFNKVLFVALSDLLEYKYNDLKTTEKYLKQSFSYFPFDPITLFGLKRLYKMTGNAEMFAFYSYLYGLREHDLDSLKEAAYVYTKLKDSTKAQKILKKIINQYPQDQDTVAINELYKQTLRNHK